MDFAERLRDSAMSKPVNNSNSDVHESWMTRKNDGTISLCLSLTALSGAHSSTEKYCVNSLSTGPRLMGSTRIQRIQTQALRRRQRNERQAVMTVRAGR